LVFLLGLLAVGRRFEQQHKLDCGFGLPTSPPASNKVRGKITSD